MEPVRSCETAGCTHCDDPYCQCDCHDEEMDCLDIEVYEDDENSC